MKKMFLLEGLDCANCASKIERKVGSLDGVKSAAVNFITTKLSIELDDGFASFDELLQQITKAAKKVDSHITVKELH